MSIRFSLRRLLIVIGVIGVALAIGVEVIIEWSNERFVITKVESLNGAVCVGFPSGGVTFSVGGLRPLVSDADVEQLSPYLAVLGVKSVCFAGTNVGDAGLKALIDSNPTALIQLDVTDTAISSESLQLLGKVRNLKIISLSKSLLTDASIRKLASMNSLCRIYVYDAKPDDERIRALVLAVKPTLIVEPRVQKDILAH